jgi:mannose-6-phosphate isomerase-like protein (cupin superfamily)
MPKSGKVWGETGEIFNNGIVSINHLKIKKGGYCSEHYHQKKSNTFFVVIGNLAIKIWKEGGLADETVIWPGESTTVEPGVYHQFRALTDVECLEIYEVELKDNDIFRRTHGGRK